MHTSTRQGAKAIPTPEIVDDVREVLRQSTAERTGGGRGRRVGAWKLRATSASGGWVGEKVFHSVRQKRAGTPRRPAERSRRSFPHRASPLPLHPRATFETPGSAGSTESRIPTTDTGAFQGARRPASHSPRRGRRKLATRTTRTQAARGRDGCRLLIMREGCWNPCFGAMRRSVEGLSRPLPGFLRVPAPTFWFDIWE